MAALRVVKLQLINCIHKLMCGMVQPSMQDVIVGALLSFHLSRKDPNARDKVVYLHSTNYQVPLPSTSSLDFFFSPFALFILSNKDHGCWIQRMA